MQRGLFLASVLVPYPKEALQSSAEAPSVAVVLCEEARFEVVPLVEHSALVVLAVERNGSRAFSSWASSSAPNPLADRKATHIPSWMPSESSVLCSARGALAFSVRIPERIGLLPPVGHQQPGSDMDLEVVLGQQACKHYRCCSVSVALERMKSMGSQASVAVLAVVHKDWYC